MLVEQQLIRQQAINAAREQGAILVYIPEDVRIPAEDLMARKYRRLPKEFRDTFKVLDELAGEGFFTRQTRDDVGIQYNITDKGRAAE